MTRRPRTPARATFAAPARSVARPVGLVIIVVAALALICGCGSSSTATSASTGVGSGGSLGPSGSGGLMVTPAKPHATSKITFSFTSPTRTGIVGKVIDSYSLSVTGPAGENCKGSHEQPGTTVAKGATERISVGPAQLGANWCVGPYTARVFEIQRAYCKPGALCPQYVRVAGIVARTSFTIAR
jgi:hypothetical protein